VGGSCFAVNTLEAITSCELLYSDDTEGYPLTHTTGGIAAVARSARIKAKTIDEKDVRRGIMPVKLQQFEILQPDHNRRLITHLQLGSKVPNGLDP